MALLCTGSLGSLLAPVWLLCSTPTCSFGFLLLLVLVADDVVHVISCGAAVASMRTGSATLWLLIFRLVVFLRHIHFVEMTCHREGSNLLQLFVFDCGIALCLRLHLSQLLR